MNGRPGRGAGRAFVGLVALTLVVSGCARAKKKEEPTKIPEITIEAREFSFTYPKTIKPGLVSITMTNKGKEAHNFELLRPSEGVTADQIKDSFAEAFQQEAMTGETARQILKMVTPFSGVGAVEPGKSAKVVLDLPGGDYFIICFEGNEQGPHFAQGMLQPLKVAGTAVEAAAPKTEATVAAQEYSFEAPKELDPGGLTFKFTNTGKQPHELSLGRLKPGKTRADVEAEIQRSAAGGQYDPQAHPVAEAGGAGTIMPGSAVYPMFDLEPGEYVFACFFPDLETGKEHALLGMYAFVTVR